MKRIFAALLALAIALVLCACGKKWTCCECGAEFRGSAYRGFREDDVMCESCAQEYYWPLPYDQFEL